MTNYWRYTPLVALTATVLLMAAAVFIVVVAERDYRQEAIEDTSADAQILARLLAPPLAAGDAGTIAAAYLASLEADRNIMAAAVYDDRGRQVSRFVRDGAGPVPERLTDASVDVEEARIAVAVPVWQDDRRLGIVYVRVVAETFADRLGRYGDLVPLGVMMLIVVGVLGIAQATVNRGNAELKRRAEALQRSNTELLEQIGRREKAEAALRQAQKMESIGQLTGGVAHDFNNLLAIILGNLERLGRRIADGADPDRLQQALHNAQTGAERAANLTRSLLAFSRRQPLQPQPVDVNRLVASMSELLRRTLGEQIVIESVVAEDLWRTLVDPNQLETAIVNLSVNARDAMPDGGRLIIETANARLDQSHAGGHDGVEPGHYVQLSITDTGVGMTPEVAAQAFEPFFTTKDVGHGTGLGLSQVYGLVKQSGGHIGISSERGRGTTVSIYLPRLATDAAPGRAAVPAPVAPVPAAGPGPRQTILVVEDNDSMREHSAATLRELGYATIEAADGAQALRALGDHPEIALMFTDVGLPGGMNGRQLAEAAGQRRPDLKVLFTTGYASNAFVQDDRSGTAIRLLTKPFTFEQLAGAVRDLLPVAAKDDKPVVLVVEDEFLVMMNTVDCLDEQGCGAIEASNAADARRELESRDGAGLAAVILDLNLPDLQGDGLVAEIRERWPSLPVVVSSGFGRDALRPELAADPKVGYLPKPFEPAQLAAVLARAGIAVANGPG